MERVLQYWDDLDDIVGALYLKADYMRSLALFTLATAAICLLQLGGILIALAKPPLAMAIVTVLLVTLLYRSATNPLK